MVGVSVEVMGDKGIGVGVGVAVVAVGVNLLLVIEAAMAEVGVNIRLGALAAVEVFIREKVSPSVVGTFRVIVIGKRCGVHPRQASNTTIHPTRLRILFILACSSTKLGASYPLLEDGSIVEQSGCEFSTVLYPNHR